MIKKNLFKNLVFKFSKLSSKINLKPTEFKLTENDNCLCLCPHPDDESIGMGGVLAKFADNFEVILLTDGQKGIKDTEQEKVVQIRQNEFEKALEVVKVNKYSSLKITDKKLIDGYDIFKTIDITKFDYIFIPNIIDQHPDHKAVALLLNRLLKEGAKHKSDLKICFYEVWSTLGFVNAFVDISDVIETKKEMISCYKSQTAQKDYEYHALGLNQYRGMLKDKKYVEAFCMLNTKDFQKMCELY